MADSTVDERPAHEADSAPVEGKTGLVLWSTPYSVLSRAFVDTEYADRPLGEFGRREPSFIIPSLLSLVLVQMPVSCQPSIRRECPHRGEAIATEQGTAGLLAWRAD